jgi:signal transduction histidine kinase
MKQQLKWWCAATVTLLLAHAVLSSTLKASYRLTVFGDVAQFVVLALAAAAVARHVLVTRGREQIFWILLSFSGVLWCISQGWWIWYEVIQRVDVPDISPGDAFLFVHVVPLMAALALRPHTQQDEHKLNMDSLDFVLLMLWWVFMYMFVVMPWQFGTSYDSKISVERFYVLYFVENIVLVCGAASLWLESNGVWRTVYQRIFMASFLYAFSSLVVNHLIAKDRYYTGSWYDVPLVAAMCLFVTVGLVDRAPAAQVAEEPAATAEHSVWPARLATVALISMPMMALWAIWASRAPHPITDFRLRVTFGAMLVMTLVVLFKQRLLNLELRRLLGESHASFVNLQRLQDQLVNSEKLAALGQLVAGAAHEINNPLTAILGYSDLLEVDPDLAEEPRSLVGKIGQQARRTKRLVANMLSFARQSPAAKSSVNVNTLLSNVMQLREPDLSGKRIRIIKKLDPQLPHVWGDSNHLLQVFLHMMNNAVDALEEVGGGTFSVSTFAQDGMAVMDFSDTGPGIKEPQRIFDPFYTTKPVGKGTGLGLSACYGIVQEHGGRITCYNNASGGATFLVHLPAEKPARERATATAATVG